MDINDLRQSWQQIGARLERLEIENKLLARKLADSELKSSAEKLVDKYRRNVWLGLVLPLIAPSVVIVLRFSMLTGILYGAFGLIMSILNIVLYRYVRQGLDFSRPVVDTLRITLQLKKMNRLVLFSGIVLGSSLIGLFIVDLIDVSQIDASYNVMGVSLGMAVGFAVGLPIGIRKARTQNHLIRQIIDDLSSIAETDEQTPSDFTSF